MIGAECAASDSTSIARRAPGGRAIEDHPDDQGEIYRDSDCQGQHAVEQQPRRNRDESLGDLPAAGLPMISGRRHDQRDRDSHESKRQQMETLLGKAELLVESGTEELISRKPKRACMPGSTMRHSFGRWSAAFESDSVSASSVSAEHSCQPQQPYVQKEIALTRDPDFHGEAHGRGFCAVRELQVSTGLSESCRPRTLGKWAMGTSRSRAAVIRRAPLQRMSRGRDGSRREVWSFARARPISSLARSARSIAAAGCSAALTRS